MQPVIDALTHAKTIDSINWYRESSTLFVSPYMTLKNMPDEEWEQLISDLNAAIQPVKDRWITKKREHALRELVKHGR